MLNIFKWIKNKRKISHDFKEDESGRAIIDLTINDKTEVLSPFVIDKKETINAEFASFLDNAVKPIPPKKKIHIDVTCKGISETDKTIFGRAIKNYYYNTCQESMRKLENNMKIFFVMCALSVLTLVLLFLVNFFDCYWLIVEVVDIVVWVFVWEAVDLLAFQRSMLLYEKYRNLSLYDCLITFNS